MAKMDKNLTGKWISGWLPIPLMVTDHSGDRDRLHIDKTLE